MNFNLRTLSIAIFTLLILNGCVKSTQIKPDQEVMNESGIILASITTNSVYDVWYYFVKDGSEEHQRMDAVGLYFLTAPDDYPDNKERTGRLSAFEVEPGKYFLSGWTIYISTGTASYYYIESETGMDKALPFTVKSGEITYLGNLHADTLFGENIFGFKIPVAGKPSITNNEELDLQILKKKYPNINQWPINIDIPDISAWN